MHPQPDSDLRPLFEQLYTELAEEEKLLHRASESVSNIYFALRNGDLATVEAAHPANVELAERMQEKAARRTELAAKLANTIGLSADRATLGELADRASEPYRSNLQKSRQVLRDLATRVEQIRVANANLINRLRSYFHDVTSGLSAQDATVRYGPTGTRVIRPDGRLTAVSG